MFKSAMVESFRARFFRFLDKRNPRQNHHKLTLKNLYIFPTKKGFLFFVFLTVLWLLGTNYQNNLILALAFLLISIFLVSKLHTFANLAGLEIELLGAANVYAGENADFFLSINNTSKRDSVGVRLMWQDSQLVPVQFDCGSKTSQKVSVALPATQRGPLSPKRLLVECEYPLGLLRCWTWLSFDAHALVYPKPIEIPLNSAAVEDEDGEGEHPAKGGEDFSELHDYRPGDSMKHIAWKLFARDRGLFTKSFSQNVSRELWLDYSQVDTQAHELKLSALCYWALRFSEQDENFGLVLPHKKIPPNKGENHKIQVLEALALCELS